jgi:cell wall-associated NlpC family hydrolase
VYAARQRCALDARLSHLQERSAPGDLVFFNNAEHVGISIGHGKFVHATHTGSTVKIARLAGSYEVNYTGAVRIR